MLRTTRMRRCDWKDVREFLEENADCKEDWGRTPWRDVFVTYGDEGAMGACVARGISQETEPVVNVPKIVTTSMTRPTDILESLLISVTEAADGRPVTVPVESGDDACVLACLSVGFRTQRSDDTPPSGVRMLFTRSIA